MYHLSRALCEGEKLLGVDQEACCQWGMFQKSSSQENQENYKEEEETKEEEKEEKWKEEKEEKWK